MKKLFKFIEESIAELKKVVWPGRDEVIASTKIVMISIVLIGLALGSVDFLLIKLMDLLF